MVVIIRRDRIRIVCVFKRIGIGDDESDVICWIAELGRSEYDIVTGIAAGKSERIGGSAVRKNRVFDIYIFLF